jgi:hypothetical protein
MCVASSGRISSRGDFTFDITPTMAGMDFRVFLRSEVPLTASWLHLYPVGVELHRLINNTNEGDAMRNKVTRRDFMKEAVGMSALAIGILTGGCELFQMTTRKIQSRPVRRDISTLSPNDPIILTY